MAPPKRIASDSIPNSNVGDYTSTKKRRRDDVDGDDDNDNDSSNINNDAIMDDDIVTAVDDDSTPMTGTGTKRRKASAIATAVPSISSSNTVPIVPQQHQHEQDRAAITYSSSTNIPTPQSRHQAGRGIPTMQNLKMPSAHTPGKNRPTTIMSSTMTPGVSVSTPIPDPNIVSKPPQPPNQRLLQVPTITTTTSSSTVTNRLVLNTPTAAQATASKTTVKVETVTEDDSHEGIRLHATSTIPETPTGLGASDKDVSLLEKLLKVILAFKQIQSPIAWLFLLIIPQLLVYNPILSMIKTTSGNGMIIYKGIFGTISSFNIEPNTTAGNLSVIITNDTFATIETLNDPKEEMVSVMTIKKDIDTFKSLLEELTTSQETVKQIQQSLDEAIEHNFQKISTPAPKLVPSTSIGASTPESIINTMRDTVNELQMLASVIENPNVTGHYTSQELLLLQSIRDKLIDESKLVDLTKLELWDMSNVTNMGSEETATTCAGASAVTETAINATNAVFADNVTDWIKGVLTTALEKVQAIVSNEDTQATSAIKSWIRHETNIILETLHLKSNATPAIGTGTDNNSADGTDGTDKNSTTPGPTSISKFRALVKTRLEIENADQTGRVDYAMVANGAKVITTGQAATSRSLVQDMPLLNKLAHVLQVRFYGYGPDIALTPTYPMNALGQCWAFAPTKPAVNDDKPLGMLTVQLAKPIYVDEIVIEHPYYEITDRMSTAPRSVTIYGYEDPLAQRSSKRYALGTFEFVVDTDSPRLQFFPIPVDDDNEIPLLRAVSLVIESNWGADYTCLYRFRVHGVEEEEEEDI
jgi:Sad1 / UNC-like C-terminal